MNAPVIFAIIIYLMLGFAFTTIYLELCNCKSGELPEDMRLVMVALIIIAFWPIFMVVSTVEILKDYL